MENQLLALAYHLDRELVVAQPLFQIERDFVDLARHRGADVDPIDRMKLRPGVELQHRFAAAALLHREQPSDGDHPPSHGTTRTAALPPDPASPPARPG